VIEIDFINGRSTPNIYGTSKYTKEIFSRINGIRINKIEYPQIGTSSLIDGILKRTIYPIIVKHQVHNTTVKHVTNQDLAFLLNFIDLRPSIVTCYDLIPVAYYNNHTWYWKMNLKGLQKADHIITISEFSKQEIIRLTGYSGDKISVIYPGVDTTYYYPKPDRSILSHYAITDNDYVIMYLGSEEPRKNISLILKAIYHLKKSLPNVKFLKVGGAQMGGDRISLVRQIKELHLEGDVIFTGQVAETDLPKYYNAADLFVFPSYYEGFGLPPLEAMACGCPVIVANKTSLPEVVGDAGLLVDPDDEEDLMKKMYEILTDDELKNKCFKHGLQSVKKFSWEKAAYLNEEIYRNQYCLFF
jgi:glycosyltransferase involved in cell wall biosynthesis